MLQCYSACAMSCCLSVDRWLQTVCMMYC